MQIYAIFLPFFAHLVGLHDNIFDEFMHTAHILVSCHKNAIKNIEKRFGMKLKLCILGIYQLIFWQQICKILYDDKYLMK